ncbi:MAG: molybdopterin adenylyltransferase [Epsilonproteobacteria bacterium]|jgi:molybdopterin adenylyltransferase|nr:molybdopterin adenylyltransferase [Campylobacterota bacterium]NPA89679.1 molybdopterin adenylyltransferase [Campylobacterota bacterium]
MGQLKIGVVTISDRASQGVYQDKSGKEIIKFLEEEVKNPFQLFYRLIPDEKEEIVATLRELVAEGCSLILTTGGTGPAPRDVTPEATREVIEREIPGFGEAMRAYSLQFVPTAILARGIGGTIGKTFILNLPGSPKAIRENLEAVWRAIPYTIDLIGGEYIDSPSAFRPKKKK